MPNVSQYKPEVNRGGTEESTNEINIQSIFAILNRHDKLINDLSVSPTNKNIYLDGLWSIYFDADRDTRIYSPADDIVELQLATAAGEFQININGVDDFTFNANSFNVLSGSAITMVDDAWIGLGAAAGRFVFDSTTAPDEIRVVDANLDLNGNDFHLDVDGDTYLHSSADDIVQLVLAGVAGEFDISINGVNDFSFTANTFNLLTGSTLLCNGVSTIDLDGNDLIIDADGDSILHAVGDDQVEIWAGGAQVAGAYNDATANQFLVTSGVWGATIYPTYSFITDRDTGIYNGSPNECTVVCGGATVAYFLQTTFYSIAPITLIDDSWIGLGSAFGRLQFDHTPTPDEIRIISANLDLNNNDFILDVDGDTYLHSSADDIVDLVLATASGEFGITINGVEDFKFTANIFTGIAGSSMLMDTLTIATGSITDSTGAISFGNENLTTTGWLAASHVDIDDYLNHAGDANTYLYFSTDRAEFYIGGKWILDMNTVAAQDYVKIGDGTDVDINLNDDLTIDGATSAVTIANLGLGVVHASAGGLLTSSTIVAADITNNTITNSQLANLGTVNYVAKFAATGLANSLIRDDGSTVGVGMAPGTPMLSVNGKLEAGKFIAGVTLGAMKFTNDVNEQSLVVYGENNAGNACAYIGTTHYGLVSLTQSVDANLYSFYTGTALDVKAGSGVTVTLKCMANNRVGIAYPTLPLGSLHIGGNDSQLVLGQAGIYNALISSADSMFFSIDADNDGTGAWYSWRKNGYSYGTSTELMQLTEAGALSLQVGPMSILSDVNGTVWGAGSDFVISYDGTYGIINSSIISASDIRITCGANKTVELQNVVYEDIRIVPGAFDRPGVSDPSTVSYTPSGAGTATYVCQFDKTNLASFTVQLPHSYKQGTDISVHVHWTPGPNGAAESGNTVGWKVDYTWADIDGTFGAMATTDCSDACDGTNHKHQMTPEVVIDGHTAAKNISSMLICNIKRTDTGADDTWAGSGSGNLPLLLEIDFHFEVNTMGSRQKLVK